MQTRSSNLRRQYSTRKDKEQPLCSQSLRMSLLCQLCRTLSMRVLTLCSIHAPLTGGCSSLEKPRALCFSLGSHRLTILYTITSKKMLLTLLTDTMLKRDGPQKLFKEVTASTIPCLPPLEPLTQKTQVETTTVQPLLQPLPQILQLQPQSLTTVVTM